MKNLLSIFRLISAPLGHKIHMIGIGGVSMSGLAQILHHDGACISGSDASIGLETEKLASMGMRISIGHSADNIDDTVELVVFSGAIHADNPEIKKAQSMHIPIIERSILLGMISRKYGHIIAISGTHGKTTTTAMIGYIFSRAGLNPTIHIGGESIDLKGNTIIGSRDILILEACEYRESFRYLRPDIGIITNVEMDHADYYTDINAVRNSFQRFASHSRSIITCQDSHINHDAVTILGIDYTYKILSTDQMGFDFEIHCMGENLDRFRLNMIGEHNIINAMYAIITALKYGIDIYTIRSAILDFRGVQRRYENIGKIAGIPVVVDYAHHPTEIECSIRGFRQVYGSFLTIFQPHTYSRTIALFDEFIRVLSDLSSLVLYATYPARECVISGGEASDIYLALKPYITDIAYTENIGELLDIIEKHSHVDAILVVGAGNLADIIKKTINVE